MADLEYGVSDPKVVNLQRVINKIMGPGAVPESGSFDEKTRDKLAELQIQMNVPQSGKLDGRTKDALKIAMEKRTKVTVNGKTAWVTKAQLKTLQAAANRQAAKSIDPYISMAAEVKSLWDANNKARENNWFWSRAVDLASGSKFPSKAMIDNAVKAANGMKTLAAAGKLSPKDLDARSVPIRNAFAAIDQYREEHFGGGAELVKNLTTIRDGCVVVLQVSAAVATGGASWQIQIGVSASVAAYETMLKEIDKASNDSKVTVGSALSEMFVAATIDATVGLILKGGGVENLVDDAVKKAAKEAAGKGVAGYLKAYAARAVAGGGKQMMEDGIKGLNSLKDPRKKFDKDDFVKAAAESFAKGAGLGIIGPAAEKFGSKASRHIKLSMFKGLGEINLDKSGEVGLKKAIDAAGPAAVEAVLKKWGPKDNHNGFEKAVIDQILADPKVNQLIAAEQKKQKKKT